VGSSSDCFAVLNDFSKYSEHFCLEIVFSITKIHAIQNARRPVPSPEKAKVGPVVVNYSPEYE